jgi:hypothetical protein
VGGLFSLETISFVLQKLFKIMESHLSHVAARVLLRKSLAVPNAS